MARVTGAADANDVTNNILPDIVRVRDKARFRTAFRAEAATVGGGNAAHTDLAAVNAANDFIIDQFNHDHITAVEAVGAYNRGWIYGLEIRRTGAGAGHQVSVDGGAN